VVWFFLLRKCFLCVSLCICRLQATYGLVSEVRMVYSILQRRFLVSACDLKSADFCIVIGGKMMLHQPVFVRAIAKSRAE
jgi:hypothetical protein